VSCQHAGYGINLVNCRDVEVIMQTSRCAIAVNMQDSTGIHVHGSMLDYAGHAGVKFNGTNDGCVIENNRIYRPCHSESTAGIYASGSSGEKTIRGNEILYPYFGQYWTWDGSGIYADHHVEHYKVTGNTVLGAHIALQDNSGSPGNVMTHNILEDCDYAIDWTDARGIGKSDLVYRDNLLINTEEGGPRTVIEHSLNIHVSL
jgi:hypothetical protein